MSRSPHHRVGTLPRLLALLLCIAVVAGPTGCAKRTKSKPEAKKEDKKSPIAGKLTREIMDAKDVKANHPDWKVEDPEVEASDPLTAYLEVYNKITHDAAQIAWTRWRQQHAILNDDRVPTFAEAEKFVKQESQGLPAVRPYRHWVYDDTTGELMLMVDIEHRNKEWKARGIAIPEDE